ncbi:hypothetical protein LTS18_012637 [Coniosporium uncinatum]|uniref:Uncharacterized protein n=1 Tax=Coniosporium uncinatum TaxID=93489 RepID=A0ACC3D925_9PEZI|nr:hypothetical protein LTS18_012637 [Coniosporium uncinatum]
MLTYLLTSFNTLVDHFSHSTTLSPTESTIASLIRDNYETIIRTYRNKVKTCTPTEWKAALNHLVELSKLILKLDLLPSNPAADASENCRARAVVINMLDAAFYNAQRSAGKMIPKCLQRARKQLGQDAKFEDHTVKARIKSRKKVRREAPVEERGRGPDMKQCVLDKVRNFIQMEREQAKHPDLKKRVALDRAATTEEKHLRKMEHRKISTWKPLKGSKLRWEECAAGLS